MYRVFNVLNLLQISYKYSTIVKVNFALEQALNAHRGSRGIALLFLQPRCLVGVGG